MAAPQTVLLVEDEEPIRRIIRRELEKTGLRVLEADNGETATMIAFQERPQLILLDVLMPKMHGMEMLQRLKEDTWGKHVPVILLTNVADDPRVQDAVRTGRAQLLSKAETKLEDIIKAVREKIA
ncbi:MAG: response regulator [Patescibacteria group bacterium]